MIDALIVSHRTADETLALLVSVPRDRFAARVLENGSGPNEVARLRAGGVEPLVSEINLGFAAGANRLAAGASGEWLLFMNPDLVAGEGLFEAVAARLPADPAVAVVGGVRAGAGPRTHGNFPGLLDRFGASGETVAAAGPFEVDWVSGCFMLVRRRAFEELRGFDEGYFMQLEDVDFCWRARAAGRRVLVDPRLAFAHRGHLSYARGGRSLARDYRAGKVRFLERSGRPLAAAALRAAHALLGLNPARAP